MKNIVVLGMHRSGTSLATRLISLSGAYVGESHQLMKPSEENPKGFWERKDIHYINDQLLQAAGCSWFNPLGFSLENIEKKTLTKLTKQSKKIISDLETFTPWVIKDPRLAITFKYWDSLIVEDPLFVVCIRQPTAVAQSLQKRNGYSIDYGLALWEFYNREIIEKVNAKDLIIFDFDAFVRDSKKSLKSFCSKMTEKGFEDFNEQNYERMEKVFDKHLVHNCGTADEIIPAAYNKFHENLLENKFQKFDSSNLDKKSIQIIDKFSALIKKKNEELKRLHSKLVLQLEDRTQWAKAVEQENIELKDKFVGLQAEFEDRSQWAKAVEQENMELKDKFVGLQAEFKDRSQRAKAVEQEKEKLKKKLSDLQAEFKDRSQWAKAVEQEKEKLEKKLSDLQAKFKDCTEWAISLDKQREGLEQKIAESQVQLTKHHQEIYDKESRINELENQIPTYQAQNQELHIQMRNIELEFITRDITFEHLVLEDENKTKQITEYDQLLRDITSSVSFKLGRTITFPVRKLLEEFILPRIEHNERAQFIVQFVRSCFSNPLQTLVLLNPERVKNFFIILFERPELSTHVMNNYLLFLDEQKQRSNTIDVPVLDKNNIFHIPDSLDECDEPAVSVVIPVYNQLEYTLQCLTSIQKNKPKISFEVIVIDDCSQDETQQILSQISGLKYIRNEENLGFLQTCNKAVDFASGQFVFLLNNDTIVTEGWLDELVRVFQEHQDAGLVGSKLVFRDGKMQECGGIIWQDASGWNFGRNDSPDKPEYNYLKEVDYVSGAAIMFAKEFFYELDKFDERFIPAYYEDTDLAFKVRQAGKKVYIQPKSVIVHFEGVTNGKDLNQGIKQNQLINQEKFRKKWEKELLSNHFKNAENVFVARDRSKGKTTVLVIDHYVPHFDKDAGSRSTFLYLELLISEGFNVKFIGDNYYQHEPYTTVLQQMGIEVLYGQYYAENWENWLQLNVAYIDIIYLHRPHISEKYIDFINQLPNKPKTIYFGHDLHYLRLLRQYEIEKNSKLLKEADDWEKREYNLFDKVDLVYYPSEFEICEIKKSRPDLNVKAIPLYIFDEIEKANHFSFDDRDGLLFVGGFNHLPNVDAIHWFCKEIFPKVREAIPDIHLYVVGSNVPQSVKELADTEIIIHGFLPDEELEALYKSVRMSVVPLRYGAGVKGKILEAMNHGVPVVTTSIGGEGIPNANTGLIIQDEAINMTESIVELYQSEELALDLVEKSFNIISEHFSREKVLSVIGSDFRV